MAKFDFRLEAVLHHRVQLEREQQRKLAACQAEVTALEGELREINKTAEASLEDLRTNRLVGRLDVQFLSAHRRYMLSVQRKTMSIAQKMTEAGTRVTEARLQLIEAARQRKMIEKLREKRLREWTEEESRRELENADEIGMRLAFVNQVSAGEENQ